MARCRYRECPRVPARQRSMRERPLPRSITNGERRARARLEPIASTPPSNRPPSRSSRRWLPVRRRSSASSA
eukprot:5458264-Prymnesium_polylepis.2